ncbi:MAG: glycosyltransferase [Desulfovibrionaceae bacterium]|nr:glycosyltransferase [Desulfovibrionaceae bacterium]
MTPELSVIIPLYNQGACIENALNSVAAQRIALEILVVDDASTDDGPERVERWAKAHAVPVRLVRQPVRGYALAARLAGVAAAVAPDILFVDADDTLLGEKRLARVLARKHEKGCELAHFRTLGQTPGGTETGEILWAAPPAQDELRKSAVFAAYAACPYPPLVFWGKIYSRALLERVMPLARGRTIFRFDDKFFVSLVVLHAQSYVGCEEYIYHYRLCESWPMTKFAGRVHDLLQLKEVIAPLLEKNDVDPQAAQTFYEFLNRRITNNMGRLCIEAEKRLFSGENPDTIFAEIMPFLDEEQLFDAALLSTHANVQSVTRTARRIYYEF